MKASLVSLLIAITAFIAYHIGLEHGETVPTAPEPVEYAETQIWTNDQDIIIETPIYKTKEETVEWFSNLFEEFGEVISVADHVVTDEYVETCIMTENSNVTIHTYSDKSFIYAIGIYPDVVNIGHAK